MAALHPLENPLRRYDWGSPTRIPALLGLPADGRPVAELWLGAHRSAPSTSAGVPLHEIVRADPVGVLGERVADRFGPRLPYLLKVLAADRSLSLQVHPRPHLARAGFHRENRLGIPAGSPERSFHDDQHKPEMVVALTEFEGLAGFRTPRSALALLDGLEGPIVDAVRAELRADRSERGVRAAFRTLLASRDSTSCPESVEKAVADVRARLGPGSPSQRADATVLALAQEHPGDPGVIASLLLNRVTLDPGDALFLPPGEVHAYLGGTAVEVMASSDNVLRAGLTSKHVDVEALLECASFAPRRPATPEITTTGTRGHVTTYRAPVPEFALTVADVDPSGPVDLPDAGPRIVLCLDGAVTLTAEHCDTGPADLPRGSSVFVPHDAGSLAVAGSGHVVCAWVP
ncbi:mannose-6-phosphate isomerase, class I [Isoptericola sp. AK164]|uniref:mannose-6-phosphate isomerase, class I n=1 Tax=Isoptericola sp. AK164 TaxID=3024246 RepID=UPI0024181C74|nr:mannose-6-phosphate isomerase, class I [Isoptericola sp. AK164]